MEVLIALLSLPLFWFAAIEAVILFACVSKEKNWVATLSLIAFGLAVHLFTSVDVIVFLKTNWLMLLKLGGAYIVLGTVWGTFKWFLYVRKTKERFIEMREEFLKDNKIDSISSELKERFNSKVRLSIGSVPPKAREHKERIIGWISYWVISLIWTFVEDFVTAIFRRLYDALSGIFQGISNRQFKEFEELKNED